MPRIRVVRVGGSLLTWSGLPDALQAWLTRQPAAANVLLAGGGTWVDLLRQAARRFALGDQPAHWMCIRALVVTAELLHALCPEAKLVDDFGRLGQSIAASADAVVLVFDVDSFLRWGEPQLPDRALPHNWDVTSDSIAARLAEVLTADSR